MRTEIKPDHSLLLLSPGTFRKCSKWTGSTNNGAYKPIIMGQLSISIHWILPQLCKAWTVTIIPSYGQGNWSTQFKLLPATRIPVWTLYSQSNYLCDSWVIHQALHSMCDFRQEPLEWSPLSQDLLPRIKPVCLQIIYLLSFIRELCCCSTSPKLDVNVMNLISNPFRVHNVNSFALLGMNMKSLPKYAVYCNPYSVKGVLNCAATMVTRHGVC